MADSVPCFEHRAFCDGFSRVGEWFRSASIGESEETFLRRAIGSYGSALG